MKRNATPQEKRPGSRKLVLGISLAVAATVIAVVAASPGLRSAAPPASAMAAAPAASSARAPLAARESDFDFGTISMAAGKVSHRFWIRNESGGPLRIQRIFTSCMCTTASLVKSARLVGTYGMPGHGPLPPVNQTLNPEEAAYLDVVFDPAAHGPAGLGPTARVVTIEHAAGTPVKLAFTANVRP
jgi:hypothetical protein